MRNKEPKVDYRLERIRDRERYIEETDKNKKRASSENNTVNLKETERNVFFDLIDRTTQPIAEEEAQT